MSYEQWAVQNPTQMIEYKRLLAKVESLSLRITATEQKLADAEKGILPERNGGLMGWINEAHEGLMDSLIFTPSALFEEELSPERRALREQEQELIVIERKKKRFHDKLQATIEECRKELHGWEYRHGDFEHITPGLYKDRDETEAQIRHFDPRAHIVDWRADTEDLSEAIDQRLFVLDFHDTPTADTLDGLIDATIEWFCEEWQIDFKFELLHTNARYRWVARAYDPHISFTRVAFNALQAIQRAFIAYLDARWDVLVSKYAAVPAPAARESEG